MFKNKIKKKKIYLKNKNKIKNQGNWKSKESSTFMVETNLTIFLIIFLNLNIFSS